ncbi:hypothetical protein LCGC14_2623220, partial [marine sediment metagenome]
RNQFLSEEERTAAGAVPRALEAAERRVKEGETSAEKIVEAMNAANAELLVKNNIEDALRTAGRHLGQVAGKAGGALDAAIAALDRAALEAEEEQLATELMELQEQKE